MWKGVRKEGKQSFRPSGVKNTTTAGVYLAVHYFVNGSDLILNKCTTKQLFFYKVLFTN